MSKIITALYNQCYENFSSILNREFENKFGLKINTYYNFILDRMVSERIDYQDFTQDQYTWIEIFSAGYECCAEQLLKDASYGTELQH